MERDAGVVSGMGGAALVIVCACVDVCVCVCECECLFECVRVSDGGGSRISGRVAAKSKRVKSFDEHQSANITATHSSIAHSQPLDRHNPCCSVEVATKDRAKILAYRENTVNKDSSMR